MQTPARIYNSDAPLNVGGGRGGLNVLPCAKVSTIQLKAFEQYSI